MRETVSSLCTRIVKKEEILSVFRDFNLVWFRLDCIYIRKEKAWHRACVSSASEPRFLNNSDVSHCFLQLFLPSDPPESRETTQPFASVCAATACACVLCSMLYSFLHVAPYLGNCICPAPPAASSFFFAKPVLFHCGAKLRPVLRDLDSVRSCCLMCSQWPRATKWRGSYAQLPWPESALLLNYSYFFIASEFYTSIFCSCKEHNKK